MSDPVTVVDLGIGNIGSVANMVRRAGGEVQLVSEPSLLAGARKVILPGVGSFDAMVGRLDGLGFRQPLLGFVSNGGMILGVCLGMQMLAESSEEGTLNGLGLVPGRVRRFHFDGDLSRLKIPHMGWNRVAKIREHGLLRGLNEDARFYFVHSYYFECRNQEDMLLKSDYGIEFASGVQRNNVFGVQFHPEKSHRFGMQLLKNFIEL